MTPTSNDTTGLGGVTEPLIPPAAGLIPPAAAEGSAQELPPKRGGGARTEQGRRRAAGNSTRHSMRAEELFPVELLSLIATCHVELIERHQPVTDYEKRWVGIMARSQAKIVHGEDLVLLDQMRLMDLAVDDADWAEHRSLAVNELAKKLSKEPQRIAALLKSSWYGAAWLWQAWSRLDAIVASSGGLDEAQHARVHDLLGIPLELRKGNPEVPAASDAAKLAELIRSELHWLEERQDGILSTRDHSDQKLTQVGWVQELDKTARLNRRYLGEARGAYRAAEARVLASQAERSALPTPACPGAAAAATEPPPYQTPPPPPPPPPDPPLDPDFDVDAELALVVADLRGTPPFEPASALLWRSLAKEEKIAVRSAFNRMGPAETDALEARILRELTTAPRVD